MLLVPGKITGHVKIFDPISKEVLVDKFNAIHYENMSEALASSIGNKGTGYIYEMHFGNGGTSIDSGGVINYLPPVSTGINADLYNKTYFKIVDDTSAANTDPARNKIEIRHTTGLRYTDIFVTCLLDFGEPADQAPFDNLSNVDSVYTFDELGLKSWAGSSGERKLLTHVVFHPVQKSLNRLVQIDYTVRIQTLTNLSSNA